MVSDVLIVEDELGVREFLRHALGRSRIPFRVAASGTQALRLATACWPDVVLLDLTLPGRLDGWQVWDALTAMAAARPLRVMVFAAEIAAADRDRATERGAYCLIRKPVLPDALVRAIVRALGQIQSETG